MSICVVVTDNVEGRAALAAATSESQRLDADLVAVNLTSGELPHSAAADRGWEVVTPDAGSDADEVEQVLRAIEQRPDVSRLVVGVRRRSPMGKALLGSLAQRLILESQVPVLSVHAEA